MNIKTAALVAMALPILSVAHAQSTCDDKLLNSLRQCERVVGTLRPDKMGQMRVYASDGSEFTAGQAQWMKQQLKLVDEACAGGNVAEASHRLAEVQELLNEHHRVS